MKKIFNKIGQVLQLLLAAPVKLPGKVGNVLKYLALGLGIVETVLDEAKDRTELDDGKVPEEVGGEKPTHEVGDRKTVLEEEGRKPTSELESDKFTSEGIGDSKSAKNGVEDNVESVDSRWANSSDSRDSSGKERGQ